MLGIPAMIRAMNGTAMRPQWVARTMQGLALLGGDVRPMTAPEAQAEALLWGTDGRVLQVGRTGAVAAEARRRGIPTLDLEGRVVLPGFVDAHTHFLHVGVKKLRPDLRGARSKEEALRRLKEFLVRHPGSSPIIAEGWDESEWKDPVRPTGKEIDGVAQRAAERLAEGGREGSERERAGRGVGPTATAQPGNAIGAKDLRTGTAKGGGRTNPAGMTPQARPIVMRRICGHIAVANEAAAPAIRARFGPQAVEPDGLVLEAASLYLNEVLPVPAATLDWAVQEASRDAHRLGVTAVGDYSQAPYRAALQRAAARGTLAVRVASSVYVQQLDAEIARGFHTGRPGLAPWDLAAKARERLAAGREAGKRPEGGGQEGRLEGRPQTATEEGRGEAYAPAASTFEPPLGLDDHFGPTPGPDGGDLRKGGTSPWLRDGGLKVFLDGSLGGHTAHLREPYLDGPPPGDPCAHAHPRGTPIWTDAEVLDHFSKAHDAGIQVHAHAIGDGAIDQGLEAFAKVLGMQGGRGVGAGGADAPTRTGRTERRGPGTGQEGREGGVDLRNPLRHRFEHFEIHHDDQVQRAARLGIVSSSQPNFVGEWSAKGGMYQDRLGQRYRLNNRFQTLRKAGMELAFGSDGMPFGPLVGLQSAVSHPVEEERLPIEQAIWHYTNRAAWSLHWPGIGSLAEGSWADVVVLDRTGLEGRPAEWSIRQTYTGGLPRLPLG